MDASELLLLVFDKLYQHFQGEESDEAKAMFVGLQGDKIVVIQPGGEHLAVLVVPALVGAPA